MKRIMLACALALAASAPAWGATYYVDFEGGSDSNDGLSETAPFQHAPGDPEAAGNPAAVALAPGDTVLLRGGVVYRGSIDIEADGAEGNPITIKGDGWGDEPATIDGSEPFGGTWTPCASQEACGGNPNWESIYFTDAPSGHTFFTTLYEDGEFLWFSQDPNPADPFYYDRIADFRTVPLGDPAITMTRTTLTDPTYFTQDDPAAWDGAYIAAWRIPNVVVIKPVTAFDPATDTITFEDLEGDLYDDRDELYSMLNVIALIDTPGEYVFDEAGGRIYLWPRSSEDPSGHVFTVAVRRYGIDLSGHSHLVIEGLRIARTFGDFVEFNLGVGIVSVASSGTAVDIVIRNNEITRIRTMEGSGAIRLLDTQDVLIEGNTLTDNQRSVGILPGGSNVVVRGNVVRRCSRQGIWFMGNTMSMIVGNTVDDIAGTHANGISVYMDSADILIAGNVVTRSPSPFTFEASSNITVVNNVFDAGDGESNVNEWGSEVTGTVVFANNTLPRNSRNASLNIGGGTAVYHVRNNIIDGFCPSAAVTDLGNNIYTGLEWCQDEGDFGEGDFLQEDLGLIFVDAAAGNFDLFADSVAVDAGSDVLALLPTSTFPGYDFTLDIRGVSRPQGAAWDIGAYEYTETPPPDESVETPDLPPDAPPDGETVPETPDGGDATDLSGDDAAPPDGDEGEDGHGGGEGCGCRLAS